MTNYKPFNLEAAKAGAKVQTRDGRPVRIVCWDVKDEDRPIIGLVCDRTDSKQEHAWYYRKNGRIYQDIVSDYDLFMAPTTRTVWRVIYRDADNNAAQRDFESSNDAGNFAICARAAMSPFSVEITS